MSQKVRKLEKFCQRSYIMILTDLSNTIKKLWEKISFHKHFKLRCNVRQDPEAIVTQFIFFYTEAYFPLGEFVRANRQKSRNSSYLFAANFFASQF